MSNNFDKFAILDSFLDEVTSYLPEIEVNLDMLQQRPSDMNVIEETYRRAHTIAGSAAMMEFTGLAHVAQGMEDILGDAIDRSAPLSAPAIALLRRSCARLSRLVEQVRAGGEDASIVTEDDQDRAGWRGHASAAGTLTLPSSAEGDLTGPPGVASYANPAMQALGAHPPVQMPDWLAAFAGPPTTETPVQPAGYAASPPADSVAQQSPPGGQLPGTGEGNPSHIPHASGEPNRQEYDRWATSISSLPTGRAPTVQPPELRQTPQYQPGQAGDLSQQPASPWQYSPPSKQSASWTDSQTNQVIHATPSGQWDQQQPSLDDMLSAFRISDEHHMPHTNTQDGPRVFGPSGVAGDTSRPASSTLSQDVSEMGTGEVPVLGSFGMRADATRSRGNLAPVGTPSTALPMLRELHEDEEIIRRHVAALSDVGSAMREAAQAMEEERTELRQFLDGSRDALERLEEWAGQQMGLDLAHSPESVRRYLPLSVIWVTTARLKRLIGLLTTSGRTLTATQEQIDEALDALRTTLNGAGQIFGAMATLGGAPSSGFSATVAQFAWSPPATSSEATASDARGDRYGTESQPQVTAAQRAELERDVREQLRRELEDDVRAEIAAEVRRDEEDRLRQELQIQVRRELLAELPPVAGGSAYTGSASAFSGMLFSAERTPKPLRVTSEQSPEALEVFRDEALEHLQSITLGLAHLEAAPGDAPAIQSIRRAMHTLKGAAGMMGFTVIQQLAHASEDLLDRLVDGALAFTPEVLSLLLDTSDTLDRLVSGSGGDEERPVLHELTTRYARLTGTPSTTSLNDLIGSTASDDAAATQIEDNVPEAPGAAASSADLSVRLQLKKLDDLVNLFGELLVNRSILEERIERLGRFVTDTVVVSERLRDVGGQLESRFEASTLPSGRGVTGTLPAGGGREQSVARWGRIGPQLGGVRGQQSSQANEFDELELDRYTEFHRLSRGLSESVADVLTLGHEMDTLIKECQTSFGRESRLSSEFQDRLLKARLVPLQSLVPRLYRAARASALKEGKEIEFFVEGTETEVDRKVIEEVAGPMLHLVRNAVNHGIELPGAREMAGKPRSGTITVSAAYEGNQVVIAVRDDGAGIDPERVRAAAVARGLIDGYTNLSDKDTINLIFRPGLTTASTVTEESGRGVGLDVVRDMVTRLRGTLEVDSSIGVGTTFTMKFPISLQIARAVLVKVGSQTLAMPMAVVDQIGRLDYYSRVPGDSASIDVRGERYPLVHLASYLKLQPATLDERASVLLVNAGRRRVALLVDGIASQQEIVSKPLGSHLREVPGVAGATVLGNGQVVLILELHELLAQQPRGTVALPPPRTSSPATPPAPVTDASTEPRAATLVSSVPTSISGVEGEAGSAASGPVREFVVAAKAPAHDVHQRIPLPTGAPRGYVLVVDDSPSVRRVVSNMLKANGWDVQTARDGVEALDVIARHMPAAVLLDIEMPRMDGYELMATVRSQDQYRQLPLIVLTSRAATKHQQRALQLGADAYVVKPYQDQDLLATIATLVQARQA